MGITGIINRFHYKLLYSNAFRTPSIENLNLEPAILPEKTNVFEMEAGLKLNENFFLTGNFFDITIKDPIVYKYIPDTEEEFYRNYDQTGSRGFELELKGVYSGFGMNLNYSYYTSAGKNMVDSYNSYNQEGEIIKNYLQGFPRQKITMHGNARIWKSLWGGANIIWQGKKYGMMETDEFQSVLDPTLTIDLVLTWNDPLKKGLSVQLGAYNITNQETWFLQPYAESFNAVYPWPGSSREFLLKLFYDLKFK